MRKLFQVIKLKFSFTLVNNIKSAKCQVYFQNTQIYVFISIISYA